MKSGREYRALSVLTPTTGTKRIDTDYYIEGYAATFSPYLYYETSDGTKVYEHFLKDAFATCDMSDVILQFDHTGRVYARQANGTLIVEPDEHGLFIAADLSKTANARDLYAEIQQGMIQRMSWGFIAGEYAYNPDTSTITHKSVKKIFDVSAVSIPANQDTEIYARALADGVIQQAETERSRRENAIRRLELRLRLGEKE